MIIRISLLASFILFSLVSWAQQGLIADYSFDSCMANDELGIQADGQVFPTVDCVCGASGSAMQFGSGLDSLLFPANLTSVFSDDFTLSFYVKFINPASRVDLISARSEDCQVDSSFIIRYSDVSKTFNIEIGETFNDFIELSADIDESVCWHHIVFSKKDMSYFLFYNGELAEEIVAVKEFMIDPINTLAISNSACLAVIENPLTGIIDEVKIFNRFVEVNELDQLNVFPDQIINQDTTIFLGDAVQIITGESCSTNPSWSPTTDVSDPNILDPILTPQVSAEYILSLPSAGCSLNDTIRVNVIDPDELDCSDLLLANAFTPNGDNLNDDFGISNSFIIEELDQFDILDRWGEVVFTTNDKNGRWDGSFKGSDTNPAMFIYIVQYQCKGESYTKSGSLSVVR